VRRSRSRVFRAGSADSAVFFRARGELLGDRGMEFNQIANTGGGGGQGGWDMCVLASNARLVTLGLVLPEAFEQLIASGAIGARS
jgi:hypothetical protein